jgi:hypothetical protein
VDVGIDRLIMLAGYARAAGARDEQQAVAVARHTPGELHMRNDPEALLRWIEENVNTAFE